MQRLLTVLASFTLCAVGSAQTASYSIVGTSCTTGRLLAAVGPVPFSVVGVPRLGSGFTVVTEGSTSYPWGARRQAFLITGLSNTSWAGLALPFDVSTLFPGEPFCGMLRASGESIMRLPAVNDYRTPVQVAIQVPNAPSLAGLRFYQQVMSLEFNPFGPPFRAGTLSAGGQGVVGF